MDNDNLETAISAQIQISTGLTGIVSKPSVEPIVLAKRWGITPEKAQNTIQATTQRGIRTMLHTLLSRRFRKNDQNLRYHHLAHPVFSDMMFASTVSRRSNRCAQLYATDFGWARAFTMASRSEAHEILSLLFARNGVLSVYLLRDGVPSTCICNNSKNWYKASSIRSSKKLYVIWNS